MNFSSFCFYNLTINYLKLFTSCNLTELLIIITELGDYEFHVWYLRFVSALLGSLVVPMVYEVGGIMFWRYINTPPELQRVFVKHLGLWKFYFKFSVKKFLVFKTPSFQPKAFISPQKMCINSLAFEYKQSFMQLQGCALRKIEESPVP